MINKKGSLQDVLLIGFFMTFFGIIILISFMLADNFNTQITTVDGIPAEALTAGNTLVSYYSGVLDNTFLFLLVGLSIVTLVLAALVRVHPIFIPLFIIGLIIIIFISGIMSNLYQEMAATTQLGPYAEQLTYVDNLLNILPFFIGIVGTLLMIVMFKTRSYIEP